MDGAVAAAPIAGTIFIVIHPVACRPCNTASPHFREVTGDPHERMDAAEGRNVSLHHLNAGCTDLN
jgi:hypothetical protein